MTLQEKIHNGDIYFCTEESFFEEQFCQLEKLYDINATRPMEYKKRGEMFRDFFAEVGENLYIELPFHANWGKNTHWGDNCYANFNLTLVDDGEI